MISKAVGNMCNKGPVKAAVTKGFPRIRIDYCTSWGYRNQLAPCSHLITQKYPSASFEYNAVPGNTGCFEVFAEDILVHSKLKTGKFIEDEDKFLDYLDEVLKSKK